MFNRISLDGFFADKKGELHSWSVDDDAVDAAARDLIHPDTALFGRVTYELFENF